MKEEEERRKEAEKWNETRQAAIEVLPEVNRRQAEADRLRQERLAQVLCGSTGLFALLLGVREA